MMRSVLIGAGLVLTCGPTLAQGASEFTAADVRLKPVAWKVRRRTAREPAGLTLV